MEVRAHTRNLRMSARKVRLVADMVRGMHAQSAIARLRMLAKASKAPLEKIIASALANAEHNFRLDAANMFIKTITVDEAAALKRWRARAYGRAAPIRKHACHITVVLDEQKGGAPAQSLRKEAAKEKGAATGVTHASPVPHEPHELESHGEDHTPSSIDPRRLGKHRNQQNVDKKELHKKKGFVKTFFNRKSGS